MRDIKVIEAEISKLQAELEDAKSHEHMRTSAVHILKNLGWTFSRRDGWMRPKPIAKEFDSSTMTHIKVGDLVTHRDIIGLFVVRAVHGNMVIVDKVIKVFTVGEACANKLRSLGARYLKVVNRNHYIGKSIL